jgi:hypothetical protein
MVGWLIAITLLFIFTTSIVVVAASMNSSRISQGEPLSEVPLIDRSGRLPLQHRRPATVRSVQE